MIQTKSIKWLILIFATLSQFTSFGQNVYSGEVVDTKNQPVPFSHIQLIGTGLGTIANQDGKFQLVIPKNSGSRTIQISSIGFVPRQVLLRDKYEKIMLQEDITELNQIIVLPRDFARELVEKAIKNIPKNYPDREERLRGFLRERVYWENEGEDNPLYVAESVVESIKKSYQASNNRGDVKLIEGRKYESTGLDTLTTRISAGSHHTHRFDVVAQRNSFLSSPNNYEFEIKDTLRLRNKSLFEVTFSHKKGSPSGYILIVDSTFSIAKAQVNYRDNFPLSYRGSGRQSLEYEVNYYQGVDSKWRLKSTNYKTKFAKQAQILVLTSSQAITNSQANVNEIAYLERIQYRDILLNKTGEYDSAFWSNYNVVLPDSKTEELFKKQPIHQAETEEEKAEKTKAKKVFAFLKKIRASYSIRYSPLSIENYDLSYTNSEFTVNESITSQGQYALSLVSAFEYEISNDLFFGFEGSSPISKYYNGSFDLYIIKEFNLNPKGRPVLLSPKIAFGHQQFLKKMGTFTSASSYEVNGVEFDSGKTEIWLQQRGFHFMPSLSLGIELSNRWQFFVQGAYNFQINQKTGLLLDETDQFFLKQKRTFLKNGKENLSIDFESQLFENLLSFSTGVYLSF